MPQSTLKLKSTVTKRDSINPNLKARLADLQQQQEKPAPKPKKEQGAPKPKRDPHALQTWFVVLAIKEACPVRIRLLSGEWLEPCLIKQMDQYTIMTDGDELLSKHAIASIKRQGERND